MYLYYYTTGVLEYNMLCIYKKSVSQICVLNEGILYVVRRFDVISPFDYVRYRMQLLMKLAKLTLIAAFATHYTRCHQLSSFDQLSSYLAN